MRGRAIVQKRVGNGNYFSLIRRLRLAAQPPPSPKGRLLVGRFPKGKQREGFWLAASDEAMCCACVPSPMRGRWRGAPDEVVDVNECPLIRLFSLRSKSHPLRHSRIGARLKKPSRLAFSYASRPTGGEKAFGSALPSNAPRSAGFSLGWRS